METSSMWTSKENKVFVVETLDTPMYRIKRRIFKDNGEKLVAFLPKESLFPSAEMQENGQAYITFGTLMCDSADAEVIAKSLQELLLLVEKEKEGSL